MFFCCDELENLWFWNWRERFIRCTKYSALYVAYVTWVHLTQYPTSRISKSRRYRSSLSIFYLFGPGFHFLRQRLVGMSPFWCVFCLEWSHFIPYRKALQQMNPLLGGEGRRAEEKKQRRLTSIPTGYTAPDGCTSLPTCPIDYASSSLMGHCRQ